MIMKIFYTILLVISMTIISCSQASSDEASSKEISEKSVNRLSVIMNEWEVRPTPNYKMGKHIPPGDIEITLTNAGKLVHNMYVLNQSSYDDLTILDDETADLSEIEVLLEISDVQPGQNGKGAISDLQPGTYAFICNIPGHYSSGTVGKFIVR